MKKILILIALVLLTIYAPIELTRIIIRDMFPVYPIGEFVFEIIFMWTLWLAGMILFWRVLCRGN